MDNQKQFILLQVNDALFPIGGYSHSYGLETYIQKELIHNRDEAAIYIANKLKYNIANSDLLTVRFAFEYAKEGALDKLMKLEEITDASKVPYEIRDASKKLGTRFWKTVMGLNISYESNIFHEYIEALSTTGIHHACIYGVFCGAVGLEKRQVLEHYLYAQTSAIVTNCVKTIPLSQTDGQILLSSCFSMLEQIIEQVLFYKEDMLNISTPGFDIRCMQHEGLYSRIYMS